MGAYITGCNWTYVSLCLQSAAREERVNKFLKCLVSASQLEKEGIKKASFLLIFWVWGVAGLSMHTVFLCSLPAWYRTTCKRLILQCHSLMFQLAFQQVAEEEGKHQTFPMSVTKLEVLCNGLQMLCVGLVLPLLTVWMYWVSLPGNVKRKKNFKKIKQAEREEWDKISHLSANT